MLCFKSFSCPLSVISLRTNQQPSQPPSPSLSKHFPAVSAGCELAKVHQNLAFSLFGMSWTVQSVQELVGNLSKNPIVSVKSDFCLVTMYRRGSHNILLGRICFLSLYSKNMNCSNQCFAYVQFWIQQDKKNLEPCVNSIWGQGRVFCLFSQSLIEEGKPDVKLLKQTSCN